MNTTDLAPLSPAAVKILTADETIDIERAFGFLQGCARLVGIPHAEWWQLDYRTGMAFPWCIIDIAAVPGPSGTDHTVLTLRFGDWRYPHDPSRATIAPTRHRALHELRLELEARAHTLRGVWELRERGHSIDLMAATRLPRPRTAKPATEAR